MLYLFSDHHHHHLYWILTERSKQHEEIKKTSREHASASKVHDIT